MECNREEAVKAKELAIQKFSEQQYSAAKTLALKAQAMCHDLDGIAQFLVVLDVFISSEVKIGNDETDWYKVLGVSASSDEETIKKQYKAKALALHPDKNHQSVVDSTEAFQLMSSAYRILSDRDSRAKHDAKRLRSRAEPANNQPDHHPHPPANSAWNQGAAQQRSRRAVGVFWTFCMSCSRYLQYREIFRGHVLYCKCCMNLLVANEVASPSTSNPEGFSSPGFGWSWAQSQGSSSRGPANDSRGPQYTTSGHAQGSAWVPPQSFFGQMNSMKRSFETTEVATNGREEGPGDSNKKRDVRQGCRDIVEVKFSNDSNHNGDDDDGSENRGGSSLKLRVV